MTEPECEFCGNTAYFVREEGYDTCGLTNHKDINGKPCEGRFVKVMTYHCLVCDEEFEVHELAK